MEKARALKVALVAVLMVVLLYSTSCVEAQNICNMNQEGFNACRPSTTPPNPTSPTAVCCSALAKADMTCLCAYKNSTVLQVLGIDPALAMQLPSKCGINPPSNC